MGLQLGHGNKKGYDAMCLHVLACIVQLWFHHRRLASCSCLIQLTKDLDKKHDSVTKKYVESHPNKNTLTKFVKDITVTMRAETTHFAMSTQIDGALWRRHPRKFPFDGGPFFNWREMGLDSQRPALSARMRPLLTNRGRIPHQVTQAKARTLIGSLMSMTSLSHPSDEVSTHKLEWNEKDNAMLDVVLLNDGGSDKGSGEEIPDLPWSPLFEEPSWKISMEQEFSSGLSQQETFFSQEFRWDEAKFFEFDEAFTATSTDPGSSFTDFDEQSAGDLSSLTASSIYSIQSRESIASEENCWYRAKIASLFAPRKRAVIKMSQNDLEVWPKNKRESTAVDGPLLVQVPPDELTRRINVMQQRQEKKARLEHLAKSPDPELRQDAEDKLREFWITAYIKKSCDDGSFPIKGNLCYV